VASSINNPLLLISGSGNLAESFVNDSLNLDPILLKEILQTFDTGKIISQLQLKTRLLTILIENQEKVAIYLGKTNLTPQNPNTQIFSKKFFLFPIQTDKSLYVLVVTDFNIYNYLNHEPFLLHNALEDFHNGLRKCLGIKNGQAYFGSTTEEMNDEERKNSGIVAIIETNFNQVTQGNQNYILFSL
jgi:hypothetical protein